MSRPPGIDLWRIDLDGWVADGIDPDSVTDDERSAADRIRTPAGGSRLLARRSATRTLLAGVLGIDVGRLAIERHCPTCGSTAHGRPSVPGAPITFSVSSSYGLAVLAVADGPVGVDVESVTVDRGTPPAGLTPNEQSRLAGLPPDRRYTGALRLWTAKEAVLKAAGRSLADDPATIEAADLLDRDTATVSDGERRWVVRHLADHRSTALPGALAVADAHGAEITWHSGG